MATRSTTMGLLASGTPVSMPPRTSTPGGAATANDYLEEEYREPWRAWRAAPGPKTMTPLLAAVSPVVDSALRSYVGTGVSPTLQTRARVLAIDAIENYDPAKAKLRTHLMSRLQSLRRHAARSSQIVSLPERMALEMGRVRLAHSEMADELGRPPTMLELADRTGLPPKRLGSLLSARPGLTHGQVVSSSAEELPSMPAVVHPARHEAWLDFVHGGLSPVDQLLFEHTTGYAGREVLPKTELARRLGLSPSAVSQRLAKIQAKIDAQERSGGLF